MKSILDMENRHSVDTARWEKWTEARRALFNHVYEDITHIGRALFLHPLTVSRNLTDDEFNTIAWNAAWTAADQLKAKGALSEVITA